MNGMFAEKMRVGVLRGGPSSEYDISLKTGAAVLKHLPEKYRPVDIFIDRGGNWHVHGLKQEPSKALQYVDVVFNALHGEYGEDGEIQYLLKSFNIPYSGSERLSSSFAMNKATAKNRLSKEGIKTPYFKILRREELGSISALASQLYRTFPQPSIIKPLSKGSSVGISIATTQHELIEALEQGFLLSDSIIIEEFIKGREATVGIIENFRGDKQYALFPVEIVLPQESRFFDYYAKYSGASKHICPGNFQREEKDELSRLARKIHDALHLRHYSNSDFIVNPRRGIYFLEVNSLPGLTSESLFPKALQAVGCEFPQFLEHILNLALARY